MAGFNTAQFNANPVTISPVPPNPVQNPFTLSPLGLLTSQGWIRFFDYAIRWMWQAAVIESPHANRLTLSQYEPKRFLPYKVFHEIDRDVFYVLQFVGTEKAWVYLRGTMSGLLADRPADLGPNDAGFTFHATDALDYRWDGTAWTPITGGVLELAQLLNLLPVYADNAAAVAGGLTANMLYRTGADPDQICIVH